MTSAAIADVPQTINYQGRLTDNQGDPLPDSTYQIMFFICDAPTEGSILWASDRVEIEVIGGLFTHQLGPLPDDIFSDGANRYLAIRVGGEDVEPRTHLIAVPYAFQSLRSDSVSAIDGASGGSILGSLDIDGALSTSADVHVSGDLTVDGNITGSISCWNHDGRSIFSGTGPSDYTDMDLSPYIGAGRKLVMLKVKNDDTSWRVTVRFRTNGDAESVGELSASGMGVSGGSMHISGNIVYVMVETDENGIVEWDIYEPTSASVTVEVWLTGWIE
jgi:hypothetical protein